MLDAFIIEELRRREEAEKRKAERPRLELPLHDGSSYGRTEPSREDEADKPKGERGVIVIDF
jgi:hypothetical protein